MAYSEHLFTAGETVTAANLNAATYTNGRYFKGKDGAVTIEAKLVVVNDAQFYLDIVSGNPSLNMDTGNDSLLYNRASDKFSFQIAGAEVAAADANGLKSGGDALPVLRHASAGRHVEHGQVYLDDGAHSDVTFANAFSGTPTFFVRGYHTDNTQSVSPEGTKFSSLSQTGVRITNDTGGGRTFHWLAIGAD